MYQGLGEVGVTQKYLAKTDPPNKHLINFVILAGSPSDDKSLATAQSWSSAIQAALMPVTP